MRQRFDIPIEMVLILRLDPNWHDGPTSKSIEARIHRALSQEFGEEFYEADVAAEDGDWGEPV